MSPAEGASGILVVDKPAGWTSHQVVGRVRRLLGTRKVGHAGTLDPMATGVLVVGVNRATRLLGQLMLTDKEYTATIRLGISTVTDDAEGDVVTSHPVTELPDDCLEAALAPLRGDIEQVPSAVSAIKVNGVRSYAKVRAGEQVTLVARPVRVSRLEVFDRRKTMLSFGPVVDLDVVVECTSGTYIRALARDLGSALGLGGHLTALRRTRVGPFDLTSAQVVDSDDPQVRLLTMPEVARRCFPVHELPVDQVAAVRVGRRLPGVVLAAPLAALVAPDGEFLALYRRGEGEAVPQAVFGAT